MSWYCDFSLYYNLHLNSSSILELNSEIFLYSNVDSLDFYIYEIFFYIEWTSSILELTSEVFLYNRVILLYAGVDI